MSMPAQRVLLIRHGETEWSASGRHTGTTDLPLTENGRRVATRLHAVLADRRFALVLVSPMQRARETCELAGLSAQAHIEPDLSEWNYGECEGLTPQQIRARWPGWIIFNDGCAGGETPSQVAARVDRVIARVRGVVGDVALFGHGHFIRLFAARWLGLPPSAGAHFLLDTATVSVVSDYRGIPAIKRWNAPLA